MSHFHGAIGGTFLHGNGDAPGAGSGPNAPTAVAGSATGGTAATSTWVSGSTDETGFLVELSTDDGATWSTSGTVGAGVQTFAHSGLIPARAYRTGITALGADANSARVVSAAWGTDNTGTGGGDLGVGGAASTGVTILYRAAPENRVYTPRP